MAELREHAAAQAALFNLDAHQKRPGDDNGVEP